MAEQKKTAQAEEKTSNPSILAEDFSDAAAFLQASAEKELPENMLDESTAHCARASFIKSSNMNISALISIS